MQEFFIAGLVGAGLIALTCVVIYEVLRFTWSRLPTLTMPPQWRILVVMGAVFGAHIVCIWLYAIVYYVLIHHLPLGTFVGETIQSGINDPSDFLSCLFFSTTTYTSLGFGDMLPTGGLRMLAGVQVLNGLVLIGWTISFTYLVMENFWQLPHGKKK